MDAFALVILGVGLAAAAGFRLFVPPLMLAAASALGLVQLPGDAQWLESPAVLAVLAVATFVEVAAYYVPLVDNLLDAVMTPAALVAGTMLAKAVLPETEGWLEWVTAILLGGGTAGFVQGLTTAGRAASTGTTFGLANPVVATGELLSSVLLSLLSLFAPVLAAAFLVALLVLLLRLLRRRRPREG